MVSHSKNIGSASTAEAENNMSSRQMSMTLKKKIEDANLPNLVAQRRMSRSRDSSASRLGALTSPNVTVGAVNILDSTKVAGIKTITRVLQRKVLDHYLEFRMEVFRKPNQMPELDLFKNLRFDEEVYELEDLEKILKEDYQQRKMGKKPFSAKPMVATERTLESDHNSEEEKEEAKEESEPSSQPSISQIAKGQELGTTAISMEFSAFIKNPKGVKLNESLNFS